MLIVFSMSNRHILLSDQKVAQVLNANNVQEATRINNIAEFVSGIIDWFRGGTQKKKRSLRYFIAYRKANMAQRRCQNTAVWRNSSS